MRLNKVMILSGIFLMTLLLFVGLFLYHIKVKIKNVDSVILIDLDNNITYKIDNKEDFINKLEVDEWEYIWNNDLKWAPRINVVLTPGDKVIEVYGEYNGKGYVRYDDCYYYIPIETYNYLIEITQ